MTCTHYVLNFLVLCAERGMSCPVYWKENKFTMSFWPGQQRPMLEAE